MSKQKFSPIFLVLSMLFCMCLIASNLMEIKVVNLGPLTITAGVIVFPISYIISDCIVEIYGFARARLVIWLGFAMNLLFSVLLQVGILLPEAPGWEGQEAMEFVFGAVPRIFFASFAAFLCGSMVNAYVMSKMKMSAKGTRGFSVRAIVSTLWGEGTDSLIFFPLAFAGVLPSEQIVTLIITQTLLKTVYEIVVLPVTLGIVKRLRKIEGDECGDLKNMSYKWWKISEL